MPKSKNNSRRKRFFQTWQYSSLLTLQIIIGMLVCIVVFLVFLNLAHEVFEQELRVFDTRIINMIYPLRTPTLTSVMMGISLWGANVTLMLAAFVSVILSLNKHRKEAFLFCTVIVTGFALNVFLKDLTQRPRPSIAPLIAESSYSFPSGHAMNAFIFYALCAYYAYHFTHRKRLSVVIAIVSLCIIGLVGVSRVYLGVHYPSDVLAGYIAGAWWFVTVLLADRALIFYRLYKKME